MFYFLETIKRYSLGARKVSPPEGDNVRALSPLFWLKESGFHMTSENRFFVCCLFCVGVM